LRKKGVYKVPTFSDEKSSDSSSDDDKADPRLQSKRAQSTDTMEMEEVDDEGIRYSDAPVRRRGGGIAGRAAGERARVTKKQPKDSDVMEMEEASEDDTAGAQATPGKQVAKQQVPVTDEEKEKILLTQWLEKMVLPRPEVY